MGAGAVVPERMTKDEAKTLAGDGCDELVDFIFGDEQVASLSTQDLEQLWLTVHTGSHERHDAVDEEAELARIIDESKLEAGKEVQRKEQLMGKDEAALTSVLEASIAEELARASRKEAAKQKQEDEEKRFLDISAREAKAEADKRARAKAAAEEAELQAALQASEHTAAAELERKRLRHEEEDSSDLFRAALRASCLDLGPRGISQAAKVFATGDPTIGQPRAGFDTTTSGARGRRTKATIGAVPTYTGTENAAGKDPVAGRSDSPGALRRKAEWAARSNTQSPSRNAGLQVIMNKSQHT